MPAALVVRQAIQAALPVHGRAAVGAAGPDAGYLGGGGVRAVLRTAAAAYQGHYARVGTQHAEVDVLNQHLAAGGGVAAVATLRVNAHCCRRCYAILSLLGLIGNVVITNPANPGGQPSDVPDLILDTICARHAYFGSVVGDLQRIRGLLWQELQALG